MCLLASFLQGGGLSVLLPSNQRQFAPSGNAAGPSYLWDYPADARVSEGERGEGGWAKCWRKSVLASSLQGSCQEGQHPQRIN